MALFHNRMLITNRTKENADFVKMLTPAGKERKKSFLDPYPGIFVDTYVPFNNEGEMLTKAKYEIFRQAAEWEAADGRRLGEPT